MNATKTNVEIRLLSESEVPDLIALAQKIWLTHYPGIISDAQIEYMLAQRYHEAQIRAEISGGDLWWDVLWTENKMSAFASYFMSETPGEMKLDKLYVHPCMQRRGYAGMLIARVLEIMRERKMHCLTLAVNKRNTTAIAAYRRYGFRIADTVVKDIGNGFVMDDYIMVRDIGAAHVQ